MDRAIPPDGLQIFNWIVFKTGLLASQRNFRDFTIDISEENMNCARPLVIFAKLILNLQLDQPRLSDRFDFADLVKNGALHRAIHTNQRNRFRAASCFSPAQGKGGDIDAQPARVLPTWPITPGSS